ncbi:MAG: zinc ribbon domain-containing protein [Gemmatimonadota bacterium]|nr:zinc ribbon domain-containing protein [Gemmatimonadota bacterium]MDH3368082.1 zinc ribbon domain-containing protein [Gemmatimonadota bacterium]MDH3477563.1 zinc ribbon domain-containing protein [Gemmatimonadota bacterium]MDH3570537.1 zinc ribbon domain-containing protein [Gemmatimonadota bacterium]MDH5549227.1 zinc ribbon domain-containing protein [Gemmatimonadota bacterium]
MDDVDRLFHYLVNHLATSAPEYLRRPFQVSELYQRLIPYRHHRTALGFGAIEDYEFALLKLLAGERGYAHLDPDDAQRALASELEAISPTPGAFREFAAASVTLDQQAVKRLLDPQTAYAPAAAAPTNPSAYAPPAITRPPGPLADFAAHATSPIDMMPTGPNDTRPIRSSELCPGCGENLPTGRPAHYCPFCGLRLGEVECRQCGETLDLAWVFCLTCGTKIDVAR